jgi:Co/Zn/Cd efflux system component
VIKARAAMVMNHRGDGPSSTAAVYAALVWDILVALSKALAAVWTGSASMTSEAIHSFVDTTNEILLLHGIHRSQQEAVPTTLSATEEKYFFGASWCRS